MKKLFGLDKVGGVGFGGWKGCVWSCTVEGGERCEDKGGRFEIWGGMVGRTCGVIAELVLRWCFVIKGIEDLVCLVLDLLQILVGNLCWVEARWADGVSRSSFKILYDEWFFQRSML